MNEFYRFVTAQADDEPSAAELMIFSQIGEWEDMGDTSAKGFAKALGTLPTSVKRLDIHINSPGGSVFEAQAIYSRLADHRSTKHVYVDGLAASAASIIAMVGHKIFIRANANMMIHMPSGLAMGNADDMRHMATALDSITESMINVYAKRTGLARDELRSLLAAETWFSPQDAVDKGFADEVRGVVKAAAVVGNNRVVINGVEHDLSRFHNVPAFTAQTPTGEKPMSKPKTKPTAAAGGGNAPPDDDDNNGNGNGNGEGEGEGTTTPTPTPTPATQPKPQTPPPPAPNPEPGHKAEYDQGVQAERERVTALQALARPATQAIVAAAIKDGKQPGEIFAECLAAMEKAGGRAARFSDASQLDGIPPSDGAGDDNGFGSLLKKKVEARKKARNRGRSVVNSRN